MAIGEDICMMLAVSIPSEASEALSTGLTKLSEELGIRVAATEIVPPERQPVSQNLKHRARIQIVGQDQPGGIISLLLMFLLLRLTTCAKRAYTISPLFLN